MQIKGTKGYARDKRKPKYQHPHGACCRGCWYYWKVKRANEAKSKVQSLEYQEGIGDYYEEG